MEFALTCALAVAAGLCIGVLSGLLGVGGGTMIVPVLKLGFGLDAISATATSLFTIVPTSLSGVVGHLRAKSCLPKLGLTMGVGGALMSPVGVWLATKSSDFAIMTITACVIAYSSFTMLRKALGMKPAAKACVSSGEPAFTLTRKQLVQGFAIGLAAGVASGYVGLGGGFLMVPLMIQVLRLPMRLTSGTSLIAIVMLAIPGVVYQAMLGNIDWLAGLAIAAGSIPGALLGARLAPRVPERTLRFAFAALLFVAAVSLFLEQLGVLG